MKLFGITGLAFRRICFDVENVVAFFRLLEHLVLIFHFGLVVSHLKDHTYLLGFAIDSVSSKERVLIFLFDLSMRYFIDKVNKVHATYIKGHNAVEQAL